MGIADDIKRLGAMGLTMAGETLSALGDMALNKADTEGPEATPKGSEADTPESNPVPTEKSEEDPKTLFWDPFAIIEQMGYKERASALTYGTLKAMVWKTPVIQAVIQTRINQVASFAQPQHDRYKLGFRLKVRETTKEPTKAERDWTAQMEPLIMRTGVTDNPRGRDNFEVFLRKICWDALTYDQMTFEVVPNRKGDPCEWYATDSATMRLADSKATYLDEDLKNETRYVQIYDGMIINEYTNSELCFGVRNPRTDIRLFGYGTSELEMLISCITSLLYAWEYNQKFFSQGSAAKGIINFKGTVPQKQLKMFRRHWYNMISGIQGAWRTPITNAEELQYINLQQSSRDMEYNAWMDFLIKVACSMYSMDPVEVNFQYGNTGQKSSLQAANNKEKITESKERGLRPLLRFIANCINTSIIWPINENFEFEFVGLDALTQGDMATLNQTRVKTTMTIDEIRAEDDLPPMPDKMGEIILDPVFLQWAQMKAGMAAQEAGGDGGFGEEGEEGEEGGGEMDFESMLAKYEGGDEDEGEDEDEDEGGKKKEPGKETKKSMNPIVWKANI